MGRPGCDGGAMSSNDPISVGRAFPPARSWLPGSEPGDDHDGGG